MIRSLSLLWSVARGACSEDIGHHSDPTRKLSNINPDGCHLLERVNKKLKRRTRVARVFPNEASLLRLVSALLTEISQDWETGKIYLNMDPSNPPTT